MDTLTLLFMLLLDISFQNLGINPKLHSSGFRISNRCSNLLQGFNSIELSDMVWKCTIFLCYISIRDIYLNIEWTSPKAPYYTWRAGRQNQKLQYFLTNFLWVKASIWTSSLVFEVPKIESFYCNVDSGQYQILSNIVIFAVIHDIRHSIEYWIAVTISSGFILKRKCTQSCCGATCFAIRQGQLCFKEERELASLAVFQI